MSILTFNFYIDRVICDKIYADADNNIVPESGIFFKRKACYNPTFFLPLQLYITENNRGLPGLVVITTQGKSGYFHTDFLPNHMPNYNFLSHEHYKDVDMSIYSRYDTDYEMILFIIPLIDWYNMLIPLKDDLYLLDLIVIGVI